MAMSTVRGRSVDSFYVLAKGGGQKKRLSILLETQIVHKNCSEPSTLFKVIQVPPLFVEMILYCKTMYCLPKRFVSSMIFHVRKLERNREVQ